MSQVVTVMSRQSQLVQLLVRLAVGAITAQAGYLKVFKGDLARSSFAGYGIPLPEIVGPFVSFLELGGGILLIVGLFTRYLGVLFAIEFIVAAYVTWIGTGKGFQPARIDILLVVAALSLAANGGGMFSSDRGRRWDA